MLINKTYNLREDLSTSLESFLFENIQKYPKEELLKVDLHCHDYNSDSPDELLGRILNLPETWTSTKTLISKLNENNVSAYTITNHNNTRSCYALLEQGYDVLVGAEFSCLVPDFSTGIHVLAYGFNPEQEVVLLNLRNNLYDFLEYACAEDIPTVWAHPLYNYKTKRKLPIIDFFRKMSLVFERFEVLNGQRDNWQNMMVKEWMSHLNPEILNLYAKKYNVEIKRYCRKPYKKSMTGGSDSHIGLFAGQTGTYFHVKDISSRLKTEKMSEIVLDSLRNGSFFPYGSNCDSTRIIISLLDYVCQVALYRKDSGLLRLLLHKGSIKDKVLSFAISNGFAELQNHKTTMKIIELFHNSFMGKKPKFYESWLIPKDYKRVFSDVSKIADLSKSNSNNMSDYKFLMETIYDQLNGLLFRRLNIKFKLFEKELSNNDYNINAILEKIEIPSEIRSFLEDKNESQQYSLTSSDKMMDMKSFLDGLSFPFLSSSIILAGHFTGAKVLHHNRKTLNKFANEIGKYKHPQKVLWLTDSYGEDNSLSIFMKSLRQEIVENDLPIDIMVCSNSVVSDNNLIAVSPTIELENPIVKNKTVRIPDFLEVQNIFETNEYDRIVCASDSIMGLLAIYLKHAYSVETSLFMYNDSLSELTSILNIDYENKKRLLRLIRLYYKSFDRIITLNQQHKDWLTDKKMAISQDKVCLSSYFVSDYMEKTPVSKNEVFGLENEDKVILYVGQLEKHYGLFELVAIYESLKNKIPRLKIVVVGEGKARNELEKLLPEAKFMGWVEHRYMNQIYSASDLMIKTSKYDSFSLSSLEAVVCNLPVIAYNNNSFSNIIDHGRNGYLVDNIRQMEEKAFKVLNSPGYYIDNAITNNKKITKRFKSDKILNKLLKDLQLDEYCKNNEKNIDEKQHKKLKEFQLI